MTAEEEKKTKTTTASDISNLLDIGGGPVHDVGARTLQEQMALLQQQQQQTQTQKKTLEGGTLQERLQLLEEQKKRDAQIKSYTTDASLVTKELIQDRLEWLQKQQAAAAAVTKKTAVSVEGGNLQHRLQLLEEQKRKDAAKNAVSYTTDASQVTKELIQDRLEWLQQQQQQQQQAAILSKKTAVSVEGGTLQHRLQLLEEQKRKDAKTVSYTTDASLVTKELIQDRLTWIEQQQSKNSTMTTSAERRTVIDEVLQGGKLQDRLKTLQEQRQKDAQTVSYTTDPSQVTRDFVYDRLSMMEEQLKNNSSNMTAVEREAIVVEGGRLKDRLALLDEQRQKDAAKLISYTTDLSLVTDELIQDRLKWIQEQNKKTHDNFHEKAALITSNELVAERIAWLREAAKQANTLPEKERLAMTQHVVAQRRAWLDEAKLQAAALPEKERVQVTQGLISERIAWLEAQKDRTAKLTHTERTKMTSDLIAERLALLKQHQQSSSSQEIELQISFLAEQQENADNMTEEEAVVMANALIDEKMNDLQTQKEMTETMSAEEQILVTNLLIDDRQAWLEGDDEKQIQMVATDHVLQQETTTTTQSAAEDVAGDCLDESTNSAAMNMIANSISFWTQQKQSVTDVSVSEQSQIASFLILEHIEALQQQLVDEANDERKQSIEQQIEFLQDQNENIEDMDHVVMIHALIDEKITGLEQQLVALV